MFNRLTFIGAVAVSTMTLAMLPTFVEGRDFNCREVWPENSTRNSAEDCVTNTSHLVRLAGESHHIGYTFMMVFALFLGVAAWIGCPIFMIGRYACGCCGSRHRRPGHCCCGGEEWDSAPDDAKASAYSTCGRVILTLFALLFLVAGVAFMILILYGAAAANDAYDDAFSQVFEILTYIDAQAAQIKLLVTKIDTGDYIRGITDQVFELVDDVKGTIRSEIQGTKDDIDPYERNLTIAAWVLGSVPVALFLVTVICAICGIRKIVPLINLGCHCFWTLPYAFLAFAFLVMAVALGDTCGEREIFLNDTDRPALVSYGLQPTCKRYLPELDQIRDQINAAIRTNAQLACSQMLQICNNQTSYSTNTPQKVYYCEELARVGATNCTTLIRAQELIEASSLKLDNDFTQCRTNFQDAASAYNLSSCTIPACAKDCTNDEVRLQAQAIVTALEYASEAEKAYREYGEPWLFCSTLLLRALEPLEACEDVMTGMMTVAIGFWCCTLLLFFGQFIVVLGMKRFSGRRHHNRKHEPVSP